MNGQEKTRARPTAFERVGERFCRCLPTGNYYARLVVGGKEIRRRLARRGLALAKRRRDELRQDAGRVDRSTGHVSLADLVDRYAIVVEKRRRVGILGRHPSG